MFSDFPNLHALVVHFPVVLLLVAAALQAVLVFKDWQPVRWIALTAMAGGFAGGIAASTTFHAMPKGLPPKAAAIFAAHEQYAGYTLWLAGITLLLAGVGEFFQIRRRAYAGLVLAAALAAAGAVSVAGHHGAQLVYVEGVGPKGNLVMSEEEEAREEKEGMHGMNMRTPGPAQKAADRPQSAAPGGSPSDKSGAGMRNMSGMEGMDMSGKASTQPASGNPKSEAPMPGMGRKDRPAKQGSGTQKPAQGADPMPDMPGMKPKKSRPEGLDMPGMDMKKGAINPPAAAHKQPPMKGMSGMGSTDNMPDMMHPGSGKQKPPASEMGDMKNMPGMGQSMPGMSMPNPMDKYRFEDNNPARTTPKSNERRKDN